MKKLQANTSLPPFSYNTAWEDNISIYDTLKKADKTVIWVLRYIGCTTCRYDVHIATKRYEEFKEKGAQIIFVMQSDKAHIQNEFKEERLPFDLICDPEMKIYHEFMIEAAKDKDELLGKKEFADKLFAKSPLIKEAGFEHGDYEGDEMQLPALFIINKDGNIDYAHYGEAIADMPNVDEILAML